MWGRLMPKTHTRTSPEWRDLLWPPGSPLWQSAESSCRKGTQASLSAVILHNLNSFSETVIFKLGLLRQVNLLTLTVTSSLPFKSIFLYPGCRAFAIVYFHQCKYPCWQMWIQDFTLGLWCTGHWLQYIRTPELNRTIAESKEKQQVQSPANS